MCLFAKATSEESHAVQLARKDVCDIPPNHRELLERGDIKLALTRNLRRITSKALVAWPLGAPVDLTAQLAVHKLEEMRRAESHRCQAGRW